MLQLIIHQLNQHLKIINSKSSSKAQILVQYPFLKMQIFGRQLQMYRTVERVHNLIIFGNFQQHRQIKIARRSLKLIIQIQKLIT